MIGLRQSLINFIYLHAAQNAFAWHGHFPGFFFEIDDHTRESHLYQVATKITSLVLPIYFSAAVVRQLRSICGCIDWQLTTNLVEYLSTLKNLKPIDL